MYIENFKRHAEWYVILKHVLGGPLGRELGGSLWEEGRGNMHSQFCFYKYILGYRNHES